MSLYHDTLLEYYKDARFKKPVADANLVSAQFNPSCGDRVSVEGRCRDGVLLSLGYQGSGCVISQAATAMLLEEAQGKTVDTVLAFDKDTVLTLLQVDLGPTRLRCALLGLSALQDALKAHQSRYMKDAL